MRIGCLQFAPQLGDVDNNLNRADAVLNRSDPGDLDLLVLPELAFSGYNFKSLQEISPYLEPSGSGITSLWTRTVALKFDCTVISGYPEKVDPSLKWPTDPEYYNAAIVVNGDGETIANYRKTHPYSTDEKWALEGPQGFFQGFFTGIGPACMGISTDLNPYRWHTAWHKFEFAHHILDSEARVVVVPMAWKTQEDARSFSRMPQEPDMVTLTYWISRLEPIIRAESEEEVIVIFANRVGVEDEVTYAGTSAVVGIRLGEVSLYGVLGRGEKDILVVDTEAPPYAKLVYRPHTGNLTTTTTSESSRYREPYSRDANRPESLTDKYTTVNLPADRAGSLLNLSKDQTTDTKHSYRRADLSISIGKAKSDTLDLELPFIHTPTAPSPTPYSIRPRLTIPPAPSVTQRYLSSHTSTSVSDTKIDSIPGFILSGEVKFDTPYPQSATSTTYTSESRFSESSAESPQLVTTSLKQPLVAAAMSRYSDTNSQERTKFFVSDGNFTQDILDESKRLSIRSDVSVWNNHQGRPRSIAMLPASPGHSDLLTEEPTTIHSTGKAELTRSTVKGHSLPQRPSSPKSRHASRSRGEGRSNSTAGGSSEIANIQPLLSDMAARAESSASFHLPSYSPSASAHARTQSRYENDSIDVRGRTSMRPRSMTPARTGSRMSIPIAMDLSLYNTSIRHEDALVIEHTTKPQESPILKPFSMERIRSMSESNRGSPSTKASFRDNEFLGNASQARGQDGMESQQISRGRERLIRKASNTSTLDPQPSEQKVIASATAPHNERVDLSKFALIEEYPSPHCPVHGQHSRSGTRSNQPQKTERSIQQHQSLNHADSTPSSVIPRSRVQAMKSDQHAISQQELKDQSPLNAVELKSQDHACESSPQVEVSALPKVSPLGYQQEPKTPKAMKILHGPIPMEDTIGNWDMPSETNQLMDSGRFSRPKSCSW